MQAPHVDRDERGVRSEALDWRRRWLRSRRAGDNAALPGFGFWMIVGGSYFLREEVAWRWSGDGGGTEEVLAGAFDFGGVVEGLVVVDDAEFGVVVEGFAGGDVLGFEGFKVVAVAVELELEVALLGKALLEVF